MGLHCILWNKFIDIVNKFAVTWENPAQFTDIVLGELYTNSVSYNRVSKLYLVNVMQPTSVI